MQITPEHIIFLLVVLSSQYRQTEAFYRSRTMCSSKRISCLSKTSFRFCFQAGSATYSYGRTKHCPNGTECNDVEGKYICVENENSIPEFQSTPTGYTNSWITELHGNSEDDVNGENASWKGSPAPNWTEVSTSSSTIHKQSTSNSDIFTIPLNVGFPTIVPTTVPLTAVGNQEAKFTKETPELETTTQNYTGENILKKTTSLLTSSLTTEPNSYISVITTTKIRRKKKPSPSKPKRIKKPTKLVEKRKSTTVTSSSYQPIKNSTSSAKKRRPTTPFRKSSTSATPLFSNSEKTPKRRRKKPQKTSSTIQVPPTRTKKPSKKMKKRKKTQKTSTTLSVTQMTSTSTTYSLPTTLQLDTTIAEISSGGAARISPTTEMSAALSIPPNKFFEVSPTSVSPPIPSPSTAIISLSAPLPCPYYLNKLFRISNSTTTEAAVSLTPPSSCRTTGKYPSKNCHEYFECLKVMWWYRLMIMKCKKGEGFNTTLLQCIPDDTCV